MPLAAQSREEPRAVLLAGQDDERRAFALVAHRGVEDRHLLAGGNVQRHAAFDTRQQQVAQPDVGEGAAHHHFVIAAPRAVLVEIRRLHALLDEVARCRAGLRDVAGRGDVIGGDRVAQQREHARTLDVAGGGRRHRHAVEVGRILHIGGTGVPGVDLAGGHLDGAPALVAVEHAGIAAA